MGMTVVFSGDEAFELIDGQQRMTTFFILLSAFINIYEKNNEPVDIFTNRIYNPVMDNNGNTKDSFVLELQYEKSSDCLGDIFHGNVPSDSKLTTLSESDRRLFGAYTTLIKYLESNYSDFAELKKFAAYFFKKVQFVQIEAKDISDALKIFETINERGVGLNPMDLLKNMIFMQVERNDFKNLNSKWKEIIEAIEDAGEKPLRILRYFITASYDITDKKTGTIKGILPEDQIYPWLMENNNQCKYKEKPFVFIKELTEGVNNYIRLSGPPPTECGYNYLVNMKRIAGSSYKSYLVLLLAAKNMDNEAFEKFAQILESMLYYYVVNHIKANETEKLFALWAPKLAKIRTTNDLKQFVTTEIVPQVQKWKSDKNHKQNFMLLNMGTLQNYRIKYILSRISRYVDEIRTGGKSFADLSSCYDSNVQIEHIMPQKCSNPLDYGVSIDDFEYEVNRLGNLTLLEKTHNAVCANKSYSEKSSTYPKSGFYITQSLPTLLPLGANTAANKLNNRMQCWTSWNKTTIEERQTMLFNLSEEIWDISNIISTW